MGASEFQQDTGKGPVPANGTLAATRPLVVDLDGSLIRTDLLLESFFQLLATYPLKAFRVVFALKHGRAALKGSVRARANEYCLSWDEPIRGHAACKMASTVAVLRRNWSLRRSAGTC